MSFPSLENLESELAACGLSREAQVHWKGFVCGCMHYLEASESQLRAEWGSLVAKIQARAKANATLPEETDITVELGHNLRETLRSLPLDDPWRAIAVHVEDPLENPEKTGKYSERIDLRIHDPDRDLDLVFEAKRLLGSNVGDYVGNDGVGRFTTAAHPYSRSPVASMLGYVLDKDLDIWFESLEKKLSKTLTCEKTKLSERSAVRYSKEKRQSHNEDFLLVHRLADFVKEYGASSKKAALP